MAGQIVIGLYRATCIRSVGCSYCGAERGEKCKKFSTLQKTLKFYGGKVVDYVHDDRSAAFMLRYVSARALQSRRG